MFVHGVLIMSENASCQTDDDIILAIPKAYDLANLPKKGRRYKSPKLFAGANWANSKVGTFAVTKGDTGLIVTWKTVDNPERSEAFESLCHDPALEDHRLELGWMMANMARIEAVRVLHSIPDPNQAMREADVFGREEARWRYWALNGSKSVIKGS